MIELEGFAVIFTLKKFHHYLLGYIWKVVIFSNITHQCKKNSWQILRNHSILGWNEVFNWSHKGDANTNCEQKSKLFNKGPILLPRKGWCFTMNHWKGWNFTSFIRISWWVLWRRLCETNHNRNFFVGRLLLAHLLQRYSWLLQKLWYMLSLYIKVYCECHFAPHTTFGTFWKMGSWFNGVIVGD
jgi:hypothetical protein